MKKHFVLDTNVLLHNHECIESFADNTVVLPMAVIEELDKFKSLNNELGRNARDVIRRLDLLRADGNLRDGAEMKDGGILKVIRCTGEFAMETDLSGQKADNRILQVAYDLHRKGETVIFVSKDINARIKADALGLKAEDFERQKVNFNELYSGYSEVDVDGEIVEEFFKNETVEAEGIGNFPNEFMMLKDRNESGKHKALARVVEPGVLTHMAKEYEMLWNIKPRNRQQRLAFELLMDPQIMLVTLVGQAGTGKTLIALAAALQSTLNMHRFDSILVSRPIIPVGKDIGYLPGSKDEKLTHWMQPIFDNLSYLLSDGRNGLNSKKPDKGEVQERTDRLITSGLIELEALTYIRGRSIPRCYIIVDEAQNLTPHEVKTIVSRAAEGTKIVLTGDPYQIDNPYLDASSNGLIYTAEHLKPLSIHGHMTLEKSERSHLAGLAAKYL